MYTSLSIYLYLIIYLYLVQMVTPSVLCQEENFKTLRQRVAKQYKDGNGTHCTLYTYMMIGWAAGGGEDFRCGCKRSGVTPGAGRSGVIPPPTPPPSALPWGSGL